MEKNINMWFKNARFYTVDLSQFKELFKDDSAMEESLQRVAFKSCAAQETATIGFAPLFGKDTPFHFSCGENHYFKLLEENKLLPSSVIKEELNELTEAKELELKRQLRKNEKDALKTAVTGKLLSQAFATRRELLIWINFDKNLVGVSATSAKRAERGLAMLREAFSSFPAQLLSPKTLVDQKMTSWLKDGEIPSRFKLGSEATLKSQDEDGGVIRASKEDLTSEEITIHLDAGKMATEIGLCFDESLDFALTSDIAVKRLKPTDIYLEHHLSEKSEDEIADMQSILVLQGELLTELSLYLLEIFDCDH